MPEPSPATEVLKVQTDSNGRATENIFHRLARLIEHLNSSGSDFTIGELSPDEIADFVSAVAIVSDGIPGCLDRPGYLLPALRTMAESARAYGRAEKLNDQLNTILLGMEQSQPQQMEEGDDQSNLNIGST